MQDENVNDFVENQERKEIDSERETLISFNKEKEAEKFLKSLEKDKKQVKSKSVSFKCTLEDYTLIRAKAILKGVSIAEFLVELARKEKVKGYEEAKEDIKKIFD